MLAVLVMVAVMGAEPMWGNNTQTKSLLHSGTGAAIGTAGGGVCTAAFRKYSEKHDAHTGTCVALTTAVSGVGYFLKERRDMRMYGDGTYRTFDKQDWAEGTGGTALGAMVYVPLIEW